MIKVKINEEERVGIDECWIGERVTRLRRKGILVTVQVRIDAENVHMVISTPGRYAHGGYWSPNRHEKEISKIWSSCGLDCSGFELSGLFAFFKKLGRMRLSA